MKDINVSSFAPAADLLFYNAVIYTADQSDTIVEALAVKNGLVVFTGSSRDALSEYGTAAEIIDLEGKMILPGFIDTHIHAPGRVLADLYSISLYEAGSIEAILEQVEAYINANPEAEIYYGEGFSLGHFSGEEVSKGPKKERLDQICADKPVVLYSSDCHLAWLNSRALQQFGLNCNTENPAGGVIEKDPRTGELWGTLKEAAMRYIPVQSFSSRQMKEAVTVFQRYLHSLGYTGILSVSIASEPPLDIFGSMAEHSELKLHVASSVTIDPENDLETQVRQLEIAREKFSFGNHTVATAKFFADGVVEGTTAYLLEPYEPVAGKGPDYYGEFLWNADNLAEAFKLVNSAGFQVHVHSIGDASTRLVIDALQKAKTETPGGDYRNTITHLQLVDSADINRFKELDIIAATQPYWHCKEPDWWEAVDHYLLGERAEREYPLQSFIRAGVRVASSSDHPVTPVPNPLRAIRAGVTRNLTCEESYGLPELKNAADPRWLLGINERASLTSMIKSFTINGAYAIFRDHLTGSLQSGKNADFVILDRDLFNLDPLEIEKVRVLKTYFNGEAVFEWKE
jgi:predicted amidohydrolase YtcJ